MLHLIKLTKCPICKNPLYLNRRNGFVECDEGCITFNHFKKARVLPEENKQSYAMIEFVEVEEKYLPEKNELVSVIK